MAAAGGLDAMTNKRYATLAELQALVGHDLGVSDWLQITQQRIDQFAEATGDHQWIHVDPARAASGPYGTTVAHGFLTLSMIPVLSDTAFAVDDVRMGINYGLNRVRFPGPVRVNSRIRALFKLLAYEAIDGGAQLVTEASIEVEGSSKPVCVAESVSRRYVG